MKECGWSRHKEVRKIETLGGGFEEQIEHQVHAGFQRFDRVFQFHSQQTAFPRVPEEVR
jgi:hypothetical protein